MVLKCSKIIASSSNAFHFSLSNIPHYLMNFIHSPEHLNSGDVVRLECDTQCNFMLTSDSDFSYFRRGSRFTYYGGKFEYFPARITVPYSGCWNITIDLGRGSANIRYNLSVTKA